MSEQTTSPSARRGAITALILLLVINLFNYIDRYVLAAVVTPLKSEFHLTDDSVGMLQTAFLYAYMLCAPLLGLLAGLFGYIIGTPLGLMVYRLLTKSP